MKTLWIALFLIGILTLSGCALVPPTPEAPAQEQVEEPEEIVYADPNVPLVLGNETINKTPDWVEETPDFVNKSQNSTTNLTNYVSNDTILTDIVTNEPELVDNNVYTNIDLTPANSFFVANWNLQIYGQTKAGKEEVLAFYDEKLSVYDIIFVQEIRDASGTAFPILCDRFEGYKCAISQRDGRSSSKEQIGVIYKDSYELIELVDLEDPDDVWERSPTKVSFNVGGYEFTAYNGHLKPDDVKAELHALEDVVELDGNVMLLGDFNADCNYYNPLFDNAFSDWDWILNEDTNVAKSNCAYDRIIVNDDMSKDIGMHGVDSEGITTTYSDHYIVYTEVKI